MSDELVARLVAQCRMVLGFAQRWEPLTPGDLRDLTRAVEAVEAAMAIPTGCLECDDGNTPHTLADEGKP